jgi:hypothetical protein
MGRWVGGGWARRAIDNNCAERGFKEFINRLQMIIEEAPEGEV